MDLLCTPASLNLVATQPGPLSTSPPPLAHPSARLPDGPGRLQCQNLLSRPPTLFHLGSPLSLRLCPRLPSCHLTGITSCLASHPSAVPYLSELPRSVVDLPARLARGDISTALPADAAPQLRASVIPEEAVVQRDIKAIGACPPPGRSAQRSGRRKQRAGAAPGAVVQGVVQSPLSQPSLPANPAGQLSALSPLSAHSMSACPGAWGRTSLMGPPTSSPQDSESQAAKRMRLGSGALASINSMVRGGAMPPPPVSMAAAYGGIGGVGVGMGVLGGISGVGACSIGSHGGVSSLGSSDTNGSLGVHAGGVAGGEGAPRWSADGPRAGEASTSGGTTSADGSNAMRTSASMADLLTSLGLGRLAAAGGGGSGQPAGSGGGLRPSNSMVQLLAALDSPTGRLTEGIAAAPAAADGTDGASCLLPSLPSSTSVTNLRSLLRNASSSTSLADLGEASLLDLQNQFAAYARAANCGAAGDSAAASGAGGGVGLPSVHSLVDMVHNSSANSLVDLMNCVNGTATGSGTATSAGAAISAPAGTDVAAGANAACAGSATASLAGSAGAVASVPSAGSAALASASAAAAAAAAAAMPSPPRPSHLVGRQLGGAGGAMQGSSGALHMQPWGSEAESGLLPSERLVMKESPSVASLVDMVRNSSATSLVEMMNSYSATNLAGMDAAHES